MRRLTALSCFLLLLCSNAGAQKITFTPQWTPQAQFAGVYVALEKGFYAEEGVDVEIRHIGRTSTVSALDMLLDGQSQVITMQLLQAIVARSDGRPVVNVMQITQHSGLCCVSRTPVKKPEDLDGMKIGRWETGFGELGDIIVNKLNLDIEWIPFIDGLAMYISGAVDATLCYTFNELIALKLALGECPEENILRVDSSRMPCPEDGLYVTEEFYRDNKDAVDRFVRATARGWDYARTHRDEAIDITMSYIQKAHIVTNRTHQSMMLDEYLELQNHTDGRPADYTRVSKALYDRLAGDLMSIGYIVSKPEYEEVIK